MLRRTLILILLGTLLLGVGAALIAYYGFYLVEYEEVPYAFAIERGVGGFDTDTERLAFGTASPGTTNKRRMTISAAQDSLLRIRFVGTGSEYLAAEPNPVTLERGVPVEMAFILTPGDNATEGNYSGTAEFRFYRR